MNALATVSKDWWIKGVAVRGECLWLTEGHKPLNKVNARMLFKIALKELAHRKGTGVIPVRSLAVVSPGHYDNRGFKLIVINLPHGGDDAVDFEIERLGLLSTETTRVFYRRQFRALRDAQSDWETERSHARRAKNQHKKEMLEASQQLLLQPSSSTSSNFKPPAIKLDPPAKPKKPSRLGTDKLGLILLDMKRKGMHKRSVSSQSSCSSSPKKKTKTMKESSSSSEKEAVKTIEKRSSSPSSGETKTETKSTSSSPRKKRKRKKLEMRKNTGGLMR